MDRKNRQIIGSIFLHTLHIGSLPLSAPPGEEERRGDEAWGKERKREEINRPFIRAEEEEGERERRRGEGRTGENGLRIKAWRERRERKEGG